MTHTTKKFYDQAGLVGIAVHMDRRTVNTLNSSTELLTDPAISGRFVSASIVLDTDSITDTQGLVIMVLRRDAGSAEISYGDEVSPSAAQVLEWGVRNASANNLDLGANIIIWLRK